MILSGGTPRSSTDWISALLAQSKPQPREARMASSTGLLLLLTAECGQGEGWGKEGAEKRKGRRGEGRGGRGNTDGTEI